MEQEKEKVVISTKAEQPKEKEVIFTDKYFDDRDKEQKEKKVVRNCYSGAKLLKQISPNEFGFKALKNSFVHKSFEYFIMLGNKSKPFSSIHDGTKAFDITFSHGIKLVNQWGKLGLLERIKPKGSRSVKVVLTKKGQRVREHLLKIQEVLNDIKKNFSKIVKNIRAKREIKK